MILNRQSEVAVDVGGVRRFARRLKAALRLGRRDFNVCFVSGREIRRLNAGYRRKPSATDVLSFPWKDGSLQGGAAKEREFAGFLGDVVICPAVARRNAREEGHAVAAEIRWLILHGVLHLLGYDHETDSGEMTELEHSLRERFDGRNRSSRNRGRGKRQGPRRPAMRRQAARR